MRTEAIIAFATEALRASGPAYETRVTPNVPASPRFDELFCEVAVGPERRERETEQHVTTRREVAVVVNAPLDEGTSRLDARVAQILAFFRRDGPGGRGFTTFERPDGRWRFELRAERPREPDERRTVVYVTDARRDETETANGRLRARVTLSLEAFEK